MTMAQQVLAAEVGMIRTSKMEKLAYKNETRLGSSCQRSEAEYREVTANVSRNGANAIIVEGTPEARTNRALIANLIGAARLPAIHTEPLGKRACRGSIRPFAPWPENPFGGVDLAYGSEGGPRRWTSI
jgi:hypothetical protein